MHFIFKGIFSIIDKGISFIKYKYGHYRSQTLISKIGKNSRCSGTVEIKYGEKINVGDYTFIGSYSVLGAMGSITIGNYVRISRGVVIETAGLDFTKPPPYVHICKPIIIEDGVWIASNAVILGGVTIGKNSIIGAGAVVTKSVEPYSVVVGKPATKIKEITFN